MSVEQPDKKQARSRGNARVVLAVVAAVLLVFAGLHRAGYALLIAGGIPTQESPGGLITLTCKYFTGTSRVITHNIHRPEEKGSNANCPLATRLPRPDPPGSPD